LFNGKDYAYWKTRMTIFLKASGYNIWKTIEDRPCVSKQKEEEWDDAEIKKISIDSIATNIDYCLLSPQEFNVCLCARVQRRYGTSFKSFMKEQAK